MTNTINDTADVLVVRRVLRASPERVFDAWLDPAKMSRWMHPGDTTHATVETDPQVGGSFRVLMHGKKDYDHKGEYLVIERPSLLVFTWNSEATKYTDSEVTIALKPVGDQTELVLTHKRLPTTAIQGHRDGWTQALELLDQMLAG